MANNYGQGSVDRYHNHPTCPPAVEVIDAEGETRMERPDHKCRAGYRARVMVTVAGKRVRKTVYGKTRAEVLTKMKALTVGEATGTLTVGANPTVEQWLNTWFEHHGRTLKENTRKSYRNKIDARLIPHLGTHRLDRLEPEHVEAMYDLMRGEGLAEGTVRQAHAVLHKALKDAVRRRKVPANVCDLVNPPSTATEQRRALTVEEAWRVLELDATPRFWLALFTGLRQGEALGLRWSDVVLEAPVPFLVVRRAMHWTAAKEVGYDTPKSAASTDRVVPLVSVLAERLATALAKHTAAGGTAEDLVFPVVTAGNPMLRDYRNWARLLKAADVPHTPLHAARQTTSQLLEAAGVSDRVVADILGHAKVAMTHHYQRGNAGAVLAAMAALDAHLAATRTATPTKLAAVAVVA